MLNYLWIQFQWFCEDSLAFFLRPIHWILARCYFPWLGIILVVLLLPLILLNDWVMERIYCRKYEILKRQLGVTEAEILAQFPPAQKDLSDGGEFAQNLAATVRNSFAWLYWQECERRANVTALMKLHAKEAQ